MKFLPFIFLFICSYECKAQELFVFADPASNMPAKSIALEMTGKFPYSKSGSRFRNRYLPLVMAGINKNLMVNVSSSFSNYYSTSGLQFDGGKIYARYRFFSNDDVHKHFRMAAFGAAGFATHKNIYDEMGLDGNSDGVQAGLIATQLLNRFAFSVTGSYLKTFAKDEAEPQHPFNRSGQAVGYSLSGGYLLFPREYTSYNQTNVNLYLELLGSKSINTSGYMVDVAPSVQLIFNSNTKINIGAAFQLEGNMLRVGQRTLQVAVERAMLNVWK